MAILSCLWMRVDLFSPHVDQGRSWERGLAKLEGGGLFRSRDFNHARLCSSRCSMCTGWKKSLAFGVWEPAIHTSIPAPLCNWPGLLTTWAGTSRGAYVAPGASIIGTVTLRKDASVWFNCTLRGLWTAVERAAVQTDSNTLQNHSHSNCI